MDQSQQARIDAIKDEVRDLHPLLALLFPKLPNVKAVEYTHGQTEMGADFVFSRYDETLGEMDYVGVIAKNAKIAQDFTGVERQIEECELERHFSGGKRKIFLTEVWIVSTAHITQGAQQKIHHKYKSRKINFIDANKLAELIDKYIPSFWTDIDVEVGDYLYTIRQETEREDKNLSLVAGVHESFYIDQDLKECDEFINGKQVSGKKIDIVDALAKRDVILVEGPMGAGKSKLIRNVIRYYATPGQFLLSALIPIRVSFREFLDTFELDPKRLIEAKTPEKLKEVNPTSFKYLLLIDGADEKNLEASELAAKILETAKAIKASGYKAVITSRWCEAYEKNSALQSNLMRLELLALTPKKLILFLQQLCKTFDQKSRIIEDLKKSTLFKELPRSPIAVIILAQLMNESSQDLPSNLTELYGKYTELSLGRWDIDKGLSSLKEFEALTSIFKTLAVKCIDNQIEKLSIEEAKEEFHAYLSKRNLGIDPNDLFNKAVKRCDIIAVDQTNGHFFFKHRTFTEFFYAKAAMSKHLTIDDRAWRPYWINTFYFYIGLHKDCPEMLREIISLPTSSEPARWTKMMNLPNYLLAGFATPYEVMNEAITSVAKDCADLYFDVAEGHIKSPFAVFPRMSFLWLMQHLIRRAYGYEFFKEAINHAALAIDDDDTMDEKKRGVALFFLSIINLELGDKACFDLLLENYDKRLPIEIDFGIKHEVEAMKNHTSILKRFEKRMVKTMRGNKKLEAQLKVMYEQPIRTTKKLTS